MNSREIQCSVGLHHTGATKLSSVKQGLLLLPLREPWRSPQTLQPLCTNSVSEGHTLGMRHCTQHSTTGQHKNSHLLLLGLKNKTKLYEMLLARRI